MTTAEFSVRPSSTRSRSSRTSSGSMLTWTPSVSAAAAPSLGRRFVSSTNDRFLNRPPRKKSGCLVTPTPDGITCSKYLHAWGLKGR